MEEVFVIEKMVVVGVWELLSDTFYTYEGKALDVCLDITEKMHRTDPTFVARVKKLVISNKYMKAKEEEKREPFQMGDAHCQVLGGIDFDENHELVIRKED